MTSFLCLNDKIKLISAVSEVMEINPSVWQSVSGQELGTGTIIDLNYVDADICKTYVCLNLDNPINKKPSQAELKYFFDNSSRANFLKGLDNLMLIESKMLNDGSIKFALCPNFSSNGMLSDHENDIRTLMNSLSISLPVAKNLLEVFQTVEQALENHESFFEGQLLSMEIENKIGEDLYWLPSAPIATSTEAEVTSHSILLPPVPPQPMPVPPPKPPKPSIFSTFFGSPTTKSTTTNSSTAPTVVMPLSVAVPPPIRNTGLLLTPQVNSMQEEKVRQLIDVISVTPKAAKKLLDKYNQDVTEAITYYYGMSTREQDALANDNDNLPLVDFPIQSDTDWDPFSALLIEEEFYSTSKSKLDNHTLCCGKCSQSASFLSGDLYKGGWTCDWPSHQGRNSFVVSDGFYCCANLLTCDYMICTECFYRNSPEFATQKDVTPAFNALVSYLKAQKSGAVGCLKQPSSGGSTMDVCFSPSSSCDKNGNDDHDDDDDDSWESSFNVTPSSMKSPHVSTSSVKQSNGDSSHVTPVPIVDVMVNCSVCSVSYLVDKLNSLVTCKHSVCSTCMSKHLTVQRKPRADPTALHHPASVKTATVMSLFLFNPLPSLPVPQSFEPFTLPVLRSDLRCPVSGCKHFLQEADIQNHAVYDEDWQQSVQEAITCISEMRAYQTCCMSGVVCDDGPQPVSHFMQLGCDHFFHPECLAPSVRTRIETERNRPHPEVVICPKCETDKSDRWCYCMTCGGGKRKHVISEQEIRGLVDNADCNFSEQDMNNWHSLAIKAYTDGCRSNSVDTNYDDSDGLVCVTCICGMSYFTDRDAENIRCTNESCKLTLCVKCMKKAHPRQTCAEAVASQAVFDESTLDLTKLGIILQYCPFCKVSGDRPKDCLHITCTCSGQYCFLCAAPYMPALCHGTAYHRPQCDLHTECCIDKCIPNGASVCKQDKYQPGPCNNCKNTMTHNVCNHSVNWKACKKCVDKGIYCQHYCTECAKSGQLCTPPLNPLKSDGSYTFKIIPKKTVERAEAAEIGTTNNSNNNNNNSKRKTVASKVSPTPISGMFKFNGVDDYF